MTRANINLEQIHNYVADLFTAAGLKEEFSHYILSVSCDDDPVYKTLTLNLEISGSPHCKTVRESRAFDYNTLIGEFAYQIAKMTRKLNGILGNEETHPIPLDLPKEWYRDLYLPRKVDMLDALPNAIGHFWADPIDYTKCSEMQKKRLEWALTYFGGHVLKEDIDKVRHCPFDMAINADSFTPINIILNKGEDTMNFTAEQKKALDQINIDASAKQAELEADRQKAIEDLKNDAEIEALRRDLDKLAWKRHTFYQSLMDQGFNSEQAMQILLNEF